MSGYVWLTEAQMERWRLFSPKSRGKPRVDDRRVLIRIIDVKKNGLQWWNDAPPAYGPPKTLSAGRARAYHAALSGAGATGAGRRDDHDRQHSPEGAPDGGKPLKRGTRPRAIGRTKGGLNSKLHRVCDGLGRPLTFFLSPGQMSDAKGTGASRGLPPANTLLAGKGYDADWFREALAGKGIAACIPARRGRKNPARHDASSTGRATGLFARLKAWRPIATRYDRCAELFLSAVCIAATVLFWL